MRAPRPDRAQLVADAIVEMRLRKPRAIMQAVDERWPDLKPGELARAAALAKARIAHIEALAEEAQERSRERVQ